jgi:hypothetical protein
VVGRAEKNHQKWLSGLSEQDLEIQEQIKAIIEERLRKVIDEN